MSGTGVEANVGVPPGSLHACYLDEIEASAPKPVRLAGVSLLLCRTRAGEVFAFENRCNHANVALHKGPWDPDSACLTCPAHQAIFALREGGRPAVGPAVLPLELFPLAQIPEGERVSLRVSVPGDDD